MMPGLFSIEAYDSDRALRERDITDAVAKPFDLNGVFAKARALLEHRRS